MVPGPETTVYMLRHAESAVLPMPNRERPLTDTGREQAEALDLYLRQLGVGFVYSSPFRRAVDTVAPFCASRASQPVEREDLRESVEGEPFDEVRARMASAVEEIVSAHPGEVVAMCTHGGTLWALMNHFDDSFGREQYRQIGNPDVRKLIFRDGEGAIDDGFEFAFDLQTDPHERRENVG